MILQQIIRVELGVYSNLVSYSLPVRWLARCPLNSSHLVCMDSDLPQYNTSRHVVQLKMMIEKTKGKNIFRCLLNSKGFVTFPTTASRAMIIGVRN